MKSPWSSILLLLMCTAGNGCSNVVMAKNEEVEKVISEKQNRLRQFSEERRLNSNAVTENYLIINTFEETLDLYSKVEDKRFSRSAPIPALFDDEFFIVVKPKLQKIQYGDIDIFKIEEENSVLNIYYKEINNEEYLLNKQKNPFVILRLKGNKPSGIKLIPAKI